MDNQPKRQYYQLNRIKEKLFEDYAEEPMGLIRNQGIVFFRPDMDFIDWLIQYANGRFILDVGCGTGHVLHLLRSGGYNKICGIEPSWDYATQAHSDIMADRDILHVFPKRVEDCVSILHDFTKDNKTLVIFCRPCHAGFVEQAIELSQSGTEFLYITKEENLRLYNDLGKYDELKEIIQYTGTAVDNEVVCRLIKP